MKNLVNEHFKYLFEAVLQKVSFKNFGISLKKSFIKERTFKEVLGHKLVNKVKVTEVLPLILKKTVLHGHSEGQNSQEKSHD